MTCYYCCLFSWYYYLCYVYITIKQLVYVPLFLVCLSCILPIIQSTRSCPICSEVLLSANPIEDLL